MGLLLHQPLLRLRMGHVSLFHIIMKAKLSCRSSQFPWKMLEITPAMSQIMLVVPHQIGRRLSFKVCCDVNGLRLETIWFVNIFLGRKWPKAEVRCEVEELFYTRLKSFKSLWPKFDSWIDTLKDRSVRVPLRPYGPSRVSIGCWLLRLMVKILVNLRLNFIFYPQWSPEIFQSLIFFRLTIKIW